MVPLHSNDVQVIRAGEKHPYWFTMRDGGPFSLAAIYNPEGFSLITTDPNELVETVHNRMPVILPKEAYRAWLDTATEVSDLKELLTAFPASEMKPILLVGELTK